MTREEAKDIIKRMYKGNPTPIQLKALEIAYAALQEPERKHGEWMGTVCSCCGKSTVDYYDCDFCPKCGAIMDGKNGEQE
ncbi:hypothetical protein AALA24_02240 [Anaerovoracaceae bacterium 42-11]